MKLVHAGGNHLQLRFMAAHEASARSPGAPAPGTVFVVLAALFTFAVAMAMIFMRERWLGESW